MSKSEAGKGSDRRKCLTTREEETIRFQLATGKITFAEFEIKYKKLKRQGKIRRK